MLADSVDSRLGVYEVLRVICERGFASEISSEVIEFALKGMDDRYAEVIVAILGFLKEYLG